MSAKADSKTSERNFEGQLVEKKYLLPVLLC